MKNRTAAFVSYRNSAEHIAKAYVTRGIAEVLHKYRVTDVGLGEIAGVNSTRLNVWKRGRALPRLPVLIAFCEAIKVPVEEFLGDISGVKE